MSGAHEWGDLRPDASDGRKKTSCSQPAGSLAVNRHWTSTSDTHLQPKLERTPVSACLACLEKASPALSSQNQTDTPAPSERNNPPFLFPLFLRPNSNRYGLYGEHELRWNRQRARLNPNQPRLEETETRPRQARSRATCLSGSEKNWAKKQAGWPSPNMPAALGPIPPPCSSLSVVSWSSFRCMALQQQRPPGIIPCSLSATRQARALWESRKPAEPTTGPRLDCDETARTALEHASPGCLWWVWKLPSRIRVSRPGPQLRAGNWSPVAF